MQMDMHPNARPEGFACRGLCLSFGHDLADGEIHSIGVLSVEGCRSKPYFVGNFYLIWHVSLLDIQYSKNLCQTSYPKEK